MRQNGHGTITLEDARTWIEETGLCLFLPRRQFAPAIAPSFVEAVAGQRNATPDPKHIALAEELLIRLEKDGIAVRLNLLGQPGEQPDFVVAAWVLPYVYALRGDRDWRRSPQLTGSRQVSPLAIQAYKLLEAGDANISSLKHTLGREVTDAAVLRAITELWQQLRIIPVIAGPGVPAKWQLLRTRFQKAIAEGASTSQVTAISVLASIYLQAVIAATMEEVEVFLSPLTARSKVREVLRGLVATRQVHTISLGHAPHFYVAGTLPEFATAPTFFASASITSSYFLHPDAREEEPAEPVFHEPATRPEPVLESIPEPAHVVAAPEPLPAPAPRTVAPHKPASHTHFSRPAAHKRDHKPATSASGRPAPRSASESRTSSARPAASRSSASHSRSASASRWSANAPKNGTGKHAAPRPASSGTSRPDAKPAVRSSKPVSTARSAKPASKPQRPAAKPVAKTGAAARKAAPSRAGSLARGARKPAAVSKTSAGKRFGYAAASRSGAKKRG